MTTTGHRRVTSLETPLTTHHTRELLIKWAILEEALLAVMIVTCQHDLLRPLRGLCLFYAEMIVIILMIIITTIIMTTWGHQVKGKLPSLYPSRPARRDLITG